MIKPKYGAVQDSSIQKNLLFRFHNFFELEILQEALFTLLNLLGKFYFHTLTSMMDGSVPGKSSISVEESAPQLRRLIRQSNTSARARSQIFRRWTSWTWGLSDKVIEVEKLYMVVNCRRWLSWTWWSSWTRWLGWTRCLTKCCTLRLIKWLWRWWRRGQRESDWQWAVILGLVILEEVPHIHNPGPFQLLKY